MSLSSLACIYHKTEGMRVVTKEDSLNLMASGLWFDNPHCKIFDGENKNEKQIRRRTRKRSNDTSDASTQI